MGILEKTLSRLGFERPLSIEEQLDQISEAIEGDTGSEDEIAHLWRPLTATALDRALKPAHHEKMLKLGDYLWSRDAFAWRTVELGVSYVWGSGLRFEANDPKVGKVLKEHYEDPVNRWESRGEELNRSLKVFGEYPMPAFTNVTNGDVHVGILDPTQIEAIEANPQNAEDLQWMRKKGGFVTGKTERYRLVHYDYNNETKYATDSNSKKHLYPWAWRYKDKNTEGRLIGNAFYFSVNRMPTASRGRSDLYCLIDFLDRYNKLRYLRMRRAEILNRYFLNLEMKRTSLAGLKKAKKKFEMPRRTGEILFTNEDMKFNFLTPDLKGGDMAAEMKTLEKPLYAGSGFPEHWFGTGGAVNRATALEMGDPTLKMLQSRQNAIKRMLKQVGQFVIDQKLIFTNDLDGVKDFSFKVVAPEISVKDQAKMATVLVQVANAIVVLLREEKLIDRAQAKQLAALLLSNFGVEFGTVFTPESGDNDKEPKEEKVKKDEKFAENLTAKVKEILEEA